jgi:hypothetical protein
MPRAGEVIALAVAVLYAMAFSSEVDTGSREEERVKTREPRF